MPVAHHSLLRLAAALAIAGSPAAAFAQGTAEQQQACTPDAVKLCSDTIPDIGKTTACMKAHFSQLTPRCQAAFNDATGGKKTAVARRSAEPAPRAHAARHVDRRVTASREPEAAPAPRVDAAPPTVAGYPPFPSPDAPLVQAPPASGPRGQIAAACRAGLIDSFTCQTTVPALLGAAQ